MQATAKVRNTSSEVVLDGGGKVTLSGGGARRILYMDTCDPAQAWTTSHCQDQATPRHGNPNDGFFTAGYPGIFFLGAGHPVVINSTLG